jgi:hypothetical protein
VIDQVEWLLMLHSFGNRRQQASPLVVAIYTPMELISTTVLAFIFLGEEPGLRQFAGALFILAGLAGTRCRSAVGAGLRVRVDPDLLPQ